MTGERRAELERLFQPHILANVGSELPDVHPVAAQAACEELSFWLLESFQPDWEAVTGAVGGAAGPEAAYLQAKTEWLADYLVTDQRSSPLAETCLNRLQAFWQAWAAEQLSGSAHQA